MILNGKRFGVLTTVNGWVFLRRENGRKLYMTPMISCNENIDRFTILKALYYISDVAQMNGDLIETDSDGNPEKFKPVSLQKAVLRTRGAIGSEKLLGPPAPTETFPVGQYTLCDVADGAELLLEPWKIENHYGGKSFRGTLVVEKERFPVVVKLWDGYKKPAEDRDREVTIYMILQSLWGKYIPRLIGTGDVETCRAIFIDEVKVSPVGDGLIGH
jgi:hypothetical protein